MISWADVEGHWRRDWLRAGALEDRDTRVHWIQAGALFVDIRIPDGRPALGERTRLAELDNPELLALMAAEGFAGTITLEEDRCTWHRELNWRGRPEGADVGRLYFDGGALIEDG
ncbi:MAG: allophanate hydrolase, partial [Pseudomonadota bacterium]